MPRVGRKSKSSKTNTTLKAIAALRKKKKAYCAPGSKTKLADVKKAGTNVKKKMVATAKRNTKGKGKNFVAGAVKLAEKKADKLIKNILSAPCATGTKSTKSKSRKTTSRKKSTAKKGTVKLTAKRNGIRYTATNQKGYSTAKAYNAAFKKAANSGKKFFTKTVGNKKYIMLSTRNRKRVILKSGQVLQGTRRRKRS